MRCLVIMVLISAVSCRRLHSFVGGKVAATRFFHRYSQACLVLPWTRSRCLRHDQLSRQCTSISSTPAAADWQEEAERLRDSFVDPFYQKRTIKPSTIEKAAEYSIDKSVGIFPGRHKYLGGAVDDRDGCIYGIPSHAGSVVCLHPNAEGGYSVRTVPLPPTTDVNCKFKWLRGILASGYLYGIPAWADSVLQVDIDALWNRRPQSADGLIKLIPLPKTHTHRTWQWHGAALNKQKTAVYCIPSNAQQVLKVDLETFCTTFIDIDVPDNFDLTLTNKWYGGILGEDNAIYGIPYRSGRVLRIDCETDTASLVGDDYGSDLWNWHGGILANGSIYAFPSHAADTVLKIDTTSCGQNCTLLPIHRTPGDTVQKYKWLGGSMGQDGNIYGMPCDASSFLKIDVETDHCSSFGNTGVDKAKWQGAVLGSDGHVYAIPSSGRSVLRINTNVNEENSFQLLGNLPVGKSKWQGGFVGQDGKIYCVPENGYRILRVTPSDVASDAKVELM